MSASEPNEPEGVRLAPKLTASELVDFCQFFASEFAGRRFDVFAYLFGTSRAADHACNLRLSSQPTNRQFEQAAAALLDELLQPLKNCKIPFSQNLIGQPLGGREARP